MTDVACGRCAEHFRPRRSTAQYCSPRYRKASARSRAVSVPQTQGGGLGRRCVPARLQDGPGGDRVKMVGFDLPFWAFTRLAEVQEPGGTGGEAGGGGGLGTMTTDPGELNYLRVMVAKKRKKNSFWVWPDRPVEERGIATEILRQGGVDVADMRIARLSVVSPRSFSRADRSS